MAQRREWSTYFVLTSQQLIRGFESRSHCDACFYARRCFKPPPWTTGPAIGYGEVMPTISYCINVRYACKVIYHGRSDCRTCGRQSHKCVYQLLTYFQVGVYFLNKDHQSNIELY